MDHPAPAGENPAVSVSRPTTGEADTAHSAHTAGTATAALEEFLAGLDSDAGRAVAWSEPERSRDDARHLDEARARGVAAGPLHGLAITVKDWIDVEGFPCQGIEPRDPPRRPRSDATVVARLRAAGAVVAAKTLAWGPDDPGTRVRHPDSPDHAPGGSSTGEAVLVARGISALGIGSDSGGSIRLPAAWCGVHGLKPSAGLVPVTGHHPPVGPREDGRTQIGPLARDLDTVEAALRVIAGPDGSDAGVAPVAVSATTGRMERFAVVLGERDWSPTDEVVAAVESAAADLERAGLARVDWDRPWLEEAMAITRDYWNRAELTGERINRHLRRWDRFATTYLEGAREVDLLLTPTAPHPAPRHRPITAGDFVFTLPASLTGSPALSIPVGRNPEGLPLAVQLVARPWEDLALIGAARLIGPDRR